MRYEDAREQMRHARTGKHLARKKVGNNTYLENRDDGAVALVLHETDVVTWWPDGRVKLETGGWYTVTTKARINEWAAPFHVHSLKGAWQVTVQNPAWSRETADGSVPYHLPVGTFHDGIVLDMTNPTATLAEPADVTAARERDKATERRIARYCRELTPETWTRVYGDAREGGTLGDCLYCRLVASDAGAETMAGTDHLLSHLDESYYMVTLTYAALREVGYRDPALIMALAEGHDTSMLRRALKRYLEARLLEGPTSGRRGNAKVSEGFA